MKYDLKLCKVHDSKNMKKGIFHFSFLKIIVCSIFLKCILNEMPKDENYRYHLVNQSVRRDKFMIDYISRKIVKQKIYFTCVFDASITIML